ncbi:MAG: hypothetical protein ABJA82_13545 [Myxococcales bacterium]
MLTGVVIRDSGSQIDIVGRARVVPMAIVAGALIAVATAIPARTGYLRSILLAGVALGIVQTIARARTRLVLQSNGFVLTGWDRLSRYRLVGKISDLDVIGVIAMLPHLEGMPYKDPDFFLQLAVAGKTYRAFRGLERSELENVSAQLVKWKDQCAV